MKQPKVSIIVPCYNVEAYLPRCMDSLLGQTLKEIEIILVDDESPDRVPAMCDEYAQQDCRVKVVHKRNGGLGFARNSGLDVATGEYVIFHDSDDYIDKDAFERLYVKANTLDLDILRFTFNTFQKEDSFHLSFYTDDVLIINDRKKLREVALCVFSVPLYPSQRQFHFPGSAWSALFRLSLIKEQGLLFHSEREILGEDYLFSYQYMQHVQRFGYMNCTFYHYRENPNSLTRKPRLDKLEMAAYNCRYVMKELEKDKYPSSAKLFAYNYFINSVRALVQQILVSDLSKDVKRKWFHNNRRNSLVQQAYKDFPVQDMKFYHRCCLWAFVKGKYGLSRLLAEINQIKKKLV